jgi:hypothetical protein
MAQHLTAMHSRHATASRLNPHPLHTMTAATCALCPLSSAATPALCKTRHRSREVQPPLP